MIGDRWEYRGRLGGTKTMSDRGVGKVSKVLGPPFFWTQNFWDPKFILTHNFLEHNILLDSQFLGTNFFGPKNFLVFCHL